MTYPDVHEIKSTIPDNPRFDPLRNESVERTCEAHEERLEFWRNEERRRLEVSKAFAQVCPKR